MSSMWVVCEANLVKLLAQGFTFELFFVPGPSVSKILLNVKKDEGYLIKHEKDKNSVYKSYINGK